MDKIKQNLFAISIGALALALAAFIYFWPVNQILSGIDGADQRLKSVDSRLNKFLKADPVPSEEYHDALAERQKQLERTILDAEDYMSAKQRRFNEFFEDKSENTSPADFKATFSTQVAEIKKKYLERFKRLSPEDAVAQGKDAKDVMPFDVQETDVSDQATVKRAMKQFWIIDQVFQTLTKMELGHLLSVRFPTARPKDELPAPPTLDLIRVNIEVQLPLAKLESFLQDLFASERVPFLDVESVQVERVPAQTIPNRIIEKSYDRSQLAEQDRETFTSQPEPEVEATLVLTVMDWKGLPKKNAADTKTESKDTKTKGT
jgi:hypothetical protein